MYGQTEEEVIATALKRHRENCEMHAAFTKVQNPKNWKLPIRAVFEGTEAELMLLQRAIIEYTGGGSSATPVSGEPGKWLVTAGGYYHHVGA